MSATDALCRLCGKATTEDLTDLLEQTRSAGHDVDPVIVHRSCFVHNPNAIVEAIGRATGTAWIIIRDR